MRYAPRTIAFVSELLHPPVTPDPAPIQKLHNRMFESGDPTYRSFNVSATGAALSNPPARPGAVSSASFLADRFQFREELTGLTVEDFAARVVEVSARVAELRGIQVFLQHSVTVRTLVNPRHFRDSRVFMGEGVFGLEDELQEFERAPQLLGLRLVFPPTPEEPQAFALKVESFQGDPRSLFLENTGSFGPQVPARGLATVGENIERTYAFVVERALAFLSRFDAPQEA